MGALKPRTEHPDPGDSGADMFMVFISGCRPFPVAVCRILFSCQVCLILHRRLDGLAGKTKILHDQKNPDPNGPFLQQIFFQGIQREGLLRGGAGSPNHIFIAASLQFLP